MIIRREVRARLERLSARFGSPLALSFTALAIAIQFHVDRDASDDLLARLFQGDTIVRFPARMRCKDGSTKSTGSSKCSRRSRGTASARAAASE